MRTASSRDDARIIPKTGPKYSVWWKVLPGNTPTRIPGDHNLPESSRERGSNNHRSPAPSSLKPESNFGPGGSMEGPMTAAGFSGYPTTNPPTASRSCLVNLSEVATDPTTIASDAAEHFWPAWPNALFAKSATAKSISALGVMTSAFLPLVSARMGKSARHLLNSAAVSNPPVRMIRSTRG